LDINSNTVIIFGIPAMFLEQEQLMITEAQLIICPNIELHLVLMAIHQLDLSESKL